MFGVNLKNPPYSFNGNGFRVNLENWKETPLNDYWNFEYERPLRSVTISDEKLRQMIENHNQEVDEYNKKYRYFSYEMNCKGKCKWSYRIERI